MEPQFEVIDDPSQEDMIARASKNAMAQFDLEHGPLLYVLLFTFKKECILHVTLHHIIGDEWSVSLLLQEIVKAYNGDNLPELKIHFSDFAVCSSGKERRNIHIL